MKDWWKPQNLSQSEKEISQISDIENLSLRNDFGSYRKAFLTGSISGTQIEEHNDIKPYAKIKSISRLIDGNNKKILDAGCGLGYSTEMIAEVYQGSEVTGIDISNDAVQFANKTHKKSRFVALPIDPNGNLPSNYDLIFCLEFYPFTRNSDLESQKDYLKLFSRHLNKNGKIVIFQNWENRNSLISIYDDLKKELPSLDFKLHKFPHIKISQYLPISLGWLPNSIFSKVKGRDLTSKILTISLK